MQLPLTQRCNPEKIPLIYFCQWQSGQAIDTIAAFKFVGRLRHASMTLCRSESAITFESCESLCETRVGSF